jgi:hypothetical protein
MAKRLAETTREAMFRGIRAIKPGATLGRHGLCGSCAFAGVAAWTVGGPSPTKPRIHGLLMYFAANPGNQGIGSRAFQAPKAVDRLNRSR